METSAPAVRRGLRRRRPLFAALAVLGATLPATATAQDAADPRVVGSFSALFVEPTIQGTATTEDCVEGVEERTGQERVLCKPAAGTIGLLPDGRLLYHNALEGTEEVDVSIVAEYGVDAINDQSRVLDLDGGDPSWISPETIAGGAAPDPSGEGQLLPAGSGNDAGTFDYNDGALFCSDLVQLPDGRLMAVGGTNYYSEPNLSDEDLDGVVELEGLNEARIFDPATDDWTQTGSMAYGRWYPTLVTQADGHVFVASGVTKLLKPVYATHPLDSGRNVVQTETYDPDTGEWTLNGGGAFGDEPLSNPANRSLPLYPRLHLLPNGNIYYNGAGQVFNPAGQAFDEPLWSIAATYDPDAASWNDLGIPGIDTAPDLGGNLVGEVGGAVGAGFRGSATSLMLTMRPDEATGEYTTSEFLTAGGIIGPSPGTYLAVPFSRIETVTVDGKEAETLSSRNTGPLAQPRWYGMQVLLPDDSALVVNGASADEVVNPGTGFPVTIAERFDPATETWTQVAEQTNPRTYHNTAILLPDGRVLLGGHAPISTAYLNNTQLPLGTSPPERDPSFQFYDPPYLFAEDRPVLTALSGLFDNGEVVTLHTPDAATLDSALIVRTATLTHLIDGDQRSVEVPILDRDPERGEVTIRVPKAEVVPPGGYMVFVREEDADGNLIPSTAQQVLVGEEATVPSQRLGGADRIATSVEVSTASFDTADTVVVARSDQFPDALTGAPLAAKEEAPLLLTRPDALDGDVATEIQRLGATEAIVLGGPAAVAPEVVEDLEDLGLAVRRVFGPDRFATAAAIAADLAPTTADVYVTKGIDADPARGWEDALTVAPLAAHQQRPILLTRTRGLPDPTVAALDAQGAQRAVVVGGDAAVSPAAEAELVAEGVTVSRLEGLDRYETSAVVHRSAVAAGMGAQRLWIATGRTFPDSLAAGPAVAAAGDSLLLVDGLALGRSERVKPRLRELAGTTTAVTVVGGPAAISRPVERAVLQLLRDE